MDVTTDGPAIDREAAAAERWDWDKDRILPLAARPDAWLNWLFVVVVAGAGVAVIAAMPDETLGLFLGGALVASAAVLATGMARRKLRSRAFGAVELRLIDATPKPGGALVGEVVIEAPTSRLARPEVNLEIRCDMMTATKPSDKHRTLYNDACLWRAQESVRLADGPSIRIPVAQALPGDLPDATVSLRIKNRCSWRLRVWAEGRKQALDETFSLPVFR